MPRFFHALWRGLTYCLLAGLILHGSLPQARAEEVSTQNPEADGQAAQHLQMLQLMPVDSVPVKNSGYVDVGGKIQPLMGVWSFFSAIHGGWIINQNAYLGLGAYALHAPKDQLNPAGDRSYQQSAMFYGGVEGGYRFPVARNLNLRAHLLLGLTSTNYFNNPIGDNNGAMDVFSNDFMVIEPGLYADLKLWRHFGVSLGVHYHFTQGAEGPEGLTQSGLNQPGVELTLKWAGD